MLVARESTMIKTTKRHTDLRQILRARQRELRDEVQSRIRDGRTGRSNEVGDDLDDSDAHTQGDLDFALLQMRSDALARLDEALIRLDAGKYGSCFECDGEISERRLRALPFAVRCQACEARREQQQGQARRVADRRGSLALFPEAASS
jgi:DnaK suppressor protein